MTYDEDTLSGLDAHYDILEAVDGEPEYNVPAAVVSAAYGYVRGGKNSVFSAIIFGLLSYAHPVFGSGIAAFDAAFVQNAELGQRARAYVGGVARRRGFAGLSGYYTGRRGRLRRFGR